MKNSILFILLLFTSSLTAQTEVLEYEFTSDSTYTFIIKQTKSNSSNPLSQELSLHTKVEATFDFFIDELICTWKEGYPEVKGPEETLDEIDTAAQEKAIPTSGLTLEYVIDYRVGEFIVENKEEIKSSIKAHNDSMFKYNSTPNDFLESTFEPDENLLAVYYPGLSLYLSMMGQSINLSETISIDIEFPNFFSDRPIPAKRKTFTSINSDKLIIINRIEEVESEVLISELVNIFKNKMEEGETIQDIKNDIKDCEMSTSYEYYYNPRKKIMERIVMKKKTKMMNQFQVDILEIEIVSSN